ncbi:MAG: 30S ribosomal protein S9 [Candidatus Altiarchaeota archaeon]
MAQSKSKSKVVNTSGKRKEAIARVTIQEGQGIVRINSMPLKNCQPNAAMMTIRRALDLASDDIELGKLNISVIVKGGGIMGQAEAVACSIARGLLEWSGSEKLLERYHGYDRTIIAGDYRQTEVHKPGQSSKGPRHKRQKSYR